MDKPSVNRFQFQETRFQGKYQASLIDTIRQAYRPVYLRGALILLLGLVGRIALLGNSNVIGYWADSLCLAAKSGDAPKVCRALPSFFEGYGHENFIHLLLILTTLGFFLTLLFRIGSSRLSAGAVSRIYDETTLRTSRYPISFFDRTPAGRVMTRFSSDYNNVFRIFGGPLAEFATLVFDLIAMTVLMGIASHWLLLIWIAQAILSYGVYRYFLPRLRRERRELALKRSPGIAHFAETLSGVATIRSFGREQPFKDRFSKLNGEYLHQRLTTTSVFIQFSLAMNVLSALTFLAMAGVSIYLSQHGLVSIGAIGVAFVYVGLAAGILQSFFEWLGQFEEAMSGLERMNEYLRLPIEPGARLPATTRFQTGHPVETQRPAGSLHAPPAFRASIEIQNLTLRYRESMEPVLNSLSLSIREGERLAVVGRTGSGKTSLVQALFRLYPLESGTIRIGGYEADLSTGAPSTSPSSHPKLALDRYRSLLSYITQDATLFLGSLRDNLDATRAYPEPELIRALKRVQFLREGATDEEYRHWLNFEVQERGRNLSAGERQLVCMARCLLEDSPIVILDEATSAVDPKSEEIITRATEEFFVGKTQLIIAHRLSTIRSCDRVLWLERGMVKKIGRPEEVLPEFEASR